jgi:hypothetical protein
MSQGFTKGTPIDTDPTLSLNSDIVVPSQKAVKSYISSIGIDSLSDVTISSPVNGNVLTYNGSLWVAQNVSSSITVGTTPIASGTIGRVLFQNGGNVVGQDSALFWDNTNKRLGIGATPATTVRLDVRAQGALSTDIGFRVRNSADTANLFDVQGNGVANVRTRMICGFSGMTDTGGSLFVYAGNANDFVARIFNTAGTGIYSFRTTGNGSYMEFNNSSGSPGVTIKGGTSDGLTFADARDIYFGTTTGTKIGAATNQKLSFWNKTPIVQPTTAIAGATLVSGGGTAITSTDTFGGYTLQQVVQALRNVGLLA